MSSPLQPDDPAAAALSGLAPVFFALGDETRLRLVALLCAGGMFSIAQLTAHTAITRQAVTKHLQVLAHAGVVRDVKVGRERLWQLDPQQIAAARQSLEAMGRQWDGALLRLKQLVESPPAQA
ncbi:MAG: metalloregulator ArsR/SmtB family transcription factor [Pseudomonadota bacterium]